MTRVQILENAGAASALAGDEMVCTCNGVSRNEIIAAVREKGCTTVADIKARTKATSTCGGCKGMVEKVLAEALGKKEPICSCTSLSRDEVVAQIREQRWTSVFEVIHALDWNSPEGCSRCRPALNYYLGMLWPEEHPDDPQSRMVNERLHANIQKDGTYSVVPRMYGGVTTPEELKRIAEIAQKFQVRMVILTGGQRIDLLGVEKKHLPDIWSELGMPSGYAYGKAVRTVKTCVGSEFCRFCVQDSTSLGIAIEKKFERLNTPAKVKMAVSGCPRNCAECGIKDVGVVGIEGGWEIYVGGNGGLKLRAAEQLCKVETAEAVLEWTGAFLQYYRENAVYGERTAQFVGRVGLAQIQQDLADEGARRELNGRIDQALSVADDPWQALSTPESKERFKELTLQ